MRYPLAPISIAVSIVSMATGQEVQRTATGDVHTKSSNLLVRRYTEGERWSYHLNGVNESWRYQIEADGIVKKDQDRHYYEEYRWPHFVSDGKLIQLTPAGLAVGKETFDDLMKVGRRADRCGDPKRHRLHRQSRLCLCERGPTAIRLRGFSDRQEKTARRTKAKACRNMSFFISRWSRFLLYRARSIERARL
jgi:hypothetical protein